MGSTWFWTRRKFPFFNLYSLTACRAPARFQG
uniref:Uncharacterized protein n=1 Tax=Arundo donax TaxID=35708 RepID=A0A0A9BWR7_ARUDO